MTYTLMAIFLLSGDPYVERTGLSLQSCADHAALAGVANTPELIALVGEIQYRCLIERPALSAAANPKDE